MPQPAFLRRLALRRLALRWLALRRLVPRRLAFRRHRGPLGLFGVAALLAACGASPAPQFFGATRHDITLEGYRFAVLQKGEHAEVIRLGYLTRAQRDAVPPLMIEAAERTTCCRVIGPAVGAMRSPSLPGDTGEARFELDC